MFIFEKQNSSNSPKLISPLKSSAVHIDLSASVEGVVGGSMQAFELLYQHFHRDLYRFALHIVKSDALAQDIVQDVFVRLWENRSKLQKELSIKSYLFTICRNLSLNMLAKAASEAHLCEEILKAYVPNPSPDDAQETYEKQARAAFEQLPPVRRKVFELAKIEGLSYQQIAEQLNISPGTVSDHIVKANRFLKEYVKNQTPVLVGLLLHLYQY